MIPPLRGARIEHVLVEREEIQGALGRSLERAVEDGRIGVDPNDSPGSGAEGELGKVARVASEIEQKIRTGVADEGEHGLTLRAELLRVISVMTIVCTPLARTRRGGQVPDPVPEIDQPRFVAGPGKSLFESLDRTARSARAEPPVEKSRERHRQKDPRCDAMPQREQGRDRLARDALRRAAVEGLNRGSGQGFEEKRVQELFLKLPGSHPVLVLPVPSERERVDEDRSGAQELDVVCRGVREGDPMGEKPELNVEVRDRGRLQQPERPLIRIRPERNLRMLQNHGIFRPVHAVVGLDRTDDEAFVDEAPIRRRASDESIFLDHRIGEHAKDPIRGDVDRPGRIPE